MGRLQEFLFQMPHKPGGARAWRVECASLLTATRRHALLAASAGEQPNCACGGRTSQDLAFRFLQTSANLFKPKAKNSWWPWVALASGVLGHPTEDLALCLVLVSKQWEVQLRSCFQQAINKFGLERPKVDSPLSVFAGAPEASKRPATAPLLDAESEVRRVCSLTRPSAWKVLGVERRASLAECRQRYRELVLLVHPDKCDDPRAGAAFRAVHEAFLAASRLVGRS